MSMDAWLLSVTCWLLGVQRRLLEARLSGSFDRGLSLRLDGIGECIRLLNETGHNDAPFLEEDASCR